MSRFGRHAIPLLVASTALACLVPTARAAQQEALAALPPPQVITQTTNAMMQPSQVPVGLRSGSWTVMTSIPPGGQDPAPVCSYGEMGEVSLSRNGAVGYSAGFDQFWQQVYTYPSVAKATSAWATMERQLQAKCRGTSTWGDQTTRVTTGRLTVPGGAGGWWVRTDVVAGTGSGSYLTVLPVAGSIQTVSMYAKSGNPTSAQRASINRLARTLSGRLAQASTLPVTQSPLLTGAQQSMLQPGDAPAELPFTQPAKGGWSAVLAYAPGVGPWTCSTTQPAKGLASFENGFGGSGDVLAEPGDLDQRVEVYATAQKAQAAWRRLSAAVLACDDPSQPPISATTPVNRRSSGTSALEFGGVPGIWVRTFDTYPAAGSTCSDDTGHVVPCPEFSTKAYSIHLLVGDSIQIVTYYKSVAGVRQVPIDQLAVNELAEMLAARWVASAS